MAALITKAIASRAQPHFAAQWSATGTLSAHVEEMYTGHALITMHGRQREATETFTERNETVHRSSFTAQFLSGVIEPAMAFDSEEQHPEPQLPQRPDRVTGHICFDDVSFRYAPDTPLIENLSLTAPPGHTIAIVGPSGAGKTTLVNLLLRFYEPTDGRIMLDGTDIAHMSRAELRTHIGLVLQDTWLTAATIADNIAYGVDGATREQVVDAARATHADHLIRTLPHGYDTALDEDGGNLSAGEKQLITIARAFLARPAVLVLDEATSSVDTRTEMLVQRAMATLRSGRTSFVIAHRLSTIRDADTILVMDSGRIAEQGTHDELLAADGVYTRLYQAQFTEERHLAESG